MTSGNIVNQFHDEYCFTTPAPLNNRIFPPQRKYMQYNAFWRSLVVFLPFFFSFFFNPLWTSFLIFEKMHVACSHVASQSALYIVKEGFVYWSLSKPSAFIEFYVWGVCRRICLDFHPTFKITCFCMRWPKYWRPSCLLFWPTYYSYCSSVTN